MRQIVDEAYRQWLTLPDDWTPQQRETFLQDLTRRLDRRAAEIADDLAAAAIKEWTARHGQHPDYLTTVGLRNTAMTSAREMVINQELYDQIPEPNDDQDVIDYDALPSPRLPANQVPWNQRWNDARYRSEPGEDLAELPLESWRVSLCGRLAWCHPRVMGWRLQRRFSLNLSSLCVTDLIAVARFITHQPPLPPSFLRDACSGKPPFTGHFCGRGICESAGQPLRWRRGAVCALAASVRWWFGQRAGGGRIAEIAQDPGEVVQADADGGMLGPVCGFGDRPLRSGGPHDER